MTKRRKRQDPRKQFPRIHQRLEDWARWVLSDKLGGLGWNVHYSDGEINIRIQRRNDTHSDPVMLEAFELLSPEDGRIWTTHSAVRELPVLWRNIIFCLYVDTPRADNQEVGERLGIDHRMIGDHLWWAFYEVDRRVLAAISCASEVA